MSADANCQVCAGTGELSERCHCTGAASRDLCIAEQQIRNLESNLHEAVEYAARLKAERDALRTGAHAIGNDIAAALNAPQWHVGRNLLAIQERLRDLLDTSAEAEKPGAERGEGVSDGR